MTKRSLDYLPDKRDAHGNRLCVWCDKPVAKRRTRYCSDECATQYWIRRSPGGMRNYIFERDHGVCALCGLDTEAFVEAFNSILLDADGKTWSALQRWWRIPDLRHFRSHTNLDERIGFEGASWVRVDLTPASWAQHEDFYRKGVTGTWYKREFASRWRRVVRLTGLWDADHTVPIIEGGDLGPENVRTLCVWCHRDATRALRARQAKQQRLWTDIPRDRVGRSLAIPKRLRAGFISRLPEQEDIVVLWLRGAVLRIVPPHVVGLRGGIFQDRVEPSAQPIPQEAHDAHAGSEPHQSGQPQE